MDQQAKNWGESFRRSDAREAAAPLKAECCGIRGTEATPRIICAVRRQHDGRFVYLDIGEGWSLCFIRYVSKRSKNFQALTNGGGRSRRTHPL